MSVREDIANKVADYTANLGTHFVEVRGEVRQLLSDMGEFIEDAEGLPCLLVHLGGQAVNHIYQHARTVTERIVEDAQMLAEDAAVYLGDPKLMQQDARELRALAGELVVGSAEMLRDIVLETEGKILDRTFYNCQ